MDVDKSFYMMDIIKVGHHCMNIYLYGFDEHFERRNIPLRVIL